MYRLGNTCFRAFLLIFVVASLSLLAIFILLNSRRSAELTVGDVEVTDTGIELNKVRYTNYKEGKIEWNVESESVNYSRVDDTTLLEDVTATFHSRSGAKYIIRGKSGKVSNKTGDMEINGDVRVRSSDGYSLETVSLKYDAADRTVSGDGPVELRKSDIRINGRGMVLNVDNGIFSITSHVRASFPL